MRELNRRRMRELNYESIFQSYKMSSEAKYEMKLPAQCKLRRTLSIIDKQNILRSYDLSHSSNSDIRQARIKPDVQNKTK